MHPTWTLIIVVVLAALLFMRPGKLSGLMEDLGKGIKGFRKGDEIRPEPPAKVRAKALEAAQTNTYRLGDQVRVQWSGKYYAAQIVEVVGKEQYRVHYDGYGSEWDENVGLSRIQPK